MFISHTHTCQSFLLVACLLCFFCAWVADLSFIGVGVVKESVTAPCGEVLVTVDSRSSRHPTCRPDQSPGRQIDVEAVAASLTAWTCPVRKKTPTSGSEAEFGKQAVGEERDGKEGQVLVESQSVPRISLCSWRCLA